MSLMKLPGGLTIRFRDECETPLLDDQADQESDSGAGLEASIRALMNGRAEALKTFHVAAALAPDPTLYELVEEWDKKASKLRWYYSRRQG